MLLSENQGQEIEF